jgi:hypothetical protein
VTAATNFGAGAGELPIILKCLAGGEAPPDLATHLSRLRELPHGALRELSVAIDATLGETVDKDSERVLDLFCSRHGVAPELLGAVLKACRFILEAAARSQAGKAEFIADLDALTGAHALTREVLAPCFERGKARLRQAILRATIEDHHKLVVDVGWQLERIVASDRGERLDVGLAALTFRYRDGGEDKRITLHLLPDALRALTQACERLAR